MFTIYAMFTLVVNKAITVNATGYQLELLLADQLKKILADVPWLRSWQVQVESLSPDNRWDVVARGKLPNGKPAQWNVECRSQMAPSQFDSLKKRVQETPKSQSIPVLAAPTVQLSPERQTTGLVPSTRENERGSWALTISGIALSAR